MEQKEQKKASKSAAKKLSQEDMVDLRTKELHKKIQEGKYNNVTYPKDGFVTIPAPLFAGFLEYVSDTKAILESLKTGFGSAIDSIQVNGDLQIVALMEQHIKNVDNGATVPADLSVVKED